MTGIVLKKTPALLAAVARIKAKVASGKSQQTPRKVKFLPGETRATVGADGFIDKRLVAMEYRRLVYSDNNARNLTPPRFTAPINIGGEEFSPWELDCCERTGIARTIRMQRATTYTNKFLLTLLCAEYRVWKLGQWAWSEETADTSRGIQI